MFTNVLLGFILPLLLLVFIFIHHPVSIFNGSLNDLLDSLRIIFISMNFETLPDGVSVVLLDVALGQAAAAAQQVPVQLHRAAHQLRLRQRGHGRATIQSGGTLIIFTD